MQNHYPFQLKPLTYSFETPEPYIDALTMEIHHDRHLKTYADNLNKALAPYPQFHGWSLERLLYENSALPEEIRKPVLNNAGGVYNHNLYFALLNTGFLRKNGDVIGQQFGGYEKFKEKMKNAALSVFGSGYAWLVNDANGKMQIITTANQNTPIPKGLHPILNLDVWEHAYYLKHYNLRANYIDDWFKLLER